MTSLACSATTLFSRSLTLPTAISSRPPTPSAGLEHARTITGSSIASNAESPWHKHKPTHLPPLLRLSSGNSDAPDSPTLVTSLIYRCPPVHYGSVLSVAPSIVSNAPSTALGSSTSDAPSEIPQRQAKLERLRRKSARRFPPQLPSPQLPTLPPLAHPGHPRPEGHPEHADAPLHARQTMRTRAHSRLTPMRACIGSPSPHVACIRPHPQKTKYVYHSGPLPPVPSIPAHLHSGRHDGGGEDDAGLIRPRQKMAARSKIGGANFNAARKAKREGRKAEPGEFVEMVGFLH